VALLAYRLPSIDESGIPGSIYVTDAYSVFVNCIPALIL
jgi:hypothetical protein